MKTTPKEEARPPFKLAIIDLFDAYHYADIVESWRYAWLDGGFAPHIDINILTAMADRLFWALNPEDSTQEKWYALDDGYDVRIYDKNDNCVYKAHEKLPRSEKEVTLPKSFERSRKLKELKLKAFDKLQELRQERIKKENK